MNIGVKPTGCTKNHLYYYAFAVGCIIGVWHITIGLRTLFVFKENEGGVAWICILLGPISTLPANLFSLLKPRFAGLWLIVGGGMSFFASLAWGNFMGVTWGTVFEFLIKFSGPMIILGVCFLVATRGATRDAAR